MAGYAVKELLFPFLINNKSDETESNAETQSEIPEEIDQDNVWELIDWFHWNINYK